MGLFADANPETFRVELSAGWVELRAVITQGDRQFADRKASGKVTGQAAKRNSPAEVGYEWSSPRYISALLARMMTAWSEDAPITIENVERLAERDIDTIMGKLNDRNIVRSEEEDAPLESSSTDVSEKQRGSGMSELIRSGLGNSGIS